MITIYDQGSERLWRFWWGSDVVINQPPAYAKIIECVPNFSEGRDLNIIQQITAAMEAVG